MIIFHAAIEKYGKNGEKTGWSFVAIPNAVAEKLKKGEKRSFRIKGMIDGVKIDQLALIPVGGGEFICPLNTELRKKIRKQAGDKVRLQIELDKSELKLNDDFVNCLKEEPTAEKFFYSLTKSHQNYFSKWIESAKTDETKANRIAKSIEGLRLNLQYGEMIRLFKNKAKQ